MQPRQTKTTIVMLAISLAGLVSACNSQPAPAKDQAAPKAISAEDRVKWYEECWNHFNDKKWDEFKQCYADNASAQQSGYGKGSAAGADAIVAGAQDFAKSFPDGKGQGQLILVNGNNIASAFVLSGANSGPLAGADGKEMKATNKRIGVLFGHALELDPMANKVVKELGVMDGATLANQLGLSPIPGRPRIVDAPPSPTVVIAKNNETEMKNLESDKAQWAAWNMHDATGVDMPEADDMVFHDMTEARDLDKKQSSAMNQMFWKAFSDAHLTTASMWPAGEYVAVTGTFEGTNDGDFPAMKLKKTGKKISAPYLEIDRFDGGKLKEAWLFFDSAAFAAQLMPAPTK